jgi:hypothetical protein
VEDDETMAATARHAMPRRSRILSRIAAPDGLAGRGLPPGMPPLPAPVIAVESA